MRTNLLFVLTSPLFSRFKTRNICKILFYRELVVVSYDYNDNDVNHNKKNDDDTTEVRLNRKDSLSSIKSASCGLK